MKQLSQFVFVCLFFTSFCHQSLAQTDDEVCGDNVAIISHMIDAKTTEFVSHVARQCLGRTPYKTVLRISTIGGSLYHAIASYELLTLAPASSQLTTIAVGPTGSSAVTVFLSGAHRKITCNGYLFVHKEAISMTAGNFSKGELMQTVRLLDYAGTMMVRIYAKATGLSKVKIEELLNSEAIISPAEAVKLGFAHEIVGDCGK
jgi:ATP-dependent protease ClpP protease subunit